MLAFFFPAAAALTLKDAAIAPGDFPLVVNKQPATILFDPADAQVVGVAAGMLAEDIERIGVKKRKPPR